MSEYDQFNFFTVIFKHTEIGQVEIRQLPSKKQTFYDLAAIPHAELTAEEHVYFTPATRNGGGRKENIVQIPCLWCDIDFKDTSEVKTKKLIAEYPLQPTAIINSGGGLHAYWLLKEPLEKSDIPEVESFLKRLADYFGGDRGVTDASHIMRVPGTVNHKYNPPRDVTLQNITRTNEYELSDFDQYLPDINQDKNSIIVKTNSGETDLESLPVSASTKALIRNGVPKGERSEIIASVLSALIRTKVSDNTIFQIFNAYPIGEKYIEKGHSKTKWLQDEINRAKAFNNENNQKKSGGSVLSELKEEFGQDKDIEFIWKDTIPKGQPIMFAGREGSGKTTILLQAANEIIETHSSGFVLWISTEGTVVDTIHKALVLGLEDKGERFQVARKRDNSFKFSLENRSDYNEFDYILTGLPGTLVVFIDSVRGMSRHSENDDILGKVMQSVNALVCDKHKSALVYLDHYKKGITADPLDKVSGSTAKTSAVRLVMGVEKKSVTTVHVKPTKNNFMGREIPELESIQVGDKVHIRELTQLTDQSTTNKCQLWLSDLMSERKKIPATKLYELGEDKNFSSSLIKKVKKELPITVDRIENRWWWFWELKG